MASSTEDDLRQKLQVTLETREKRNQISALLTIVWEETDLKGVEEEAKEVRDFFHDELHFVVQHFAIPLSKSYQLLHSAIIDFLKQYESSAGLIVLYYGGHGDNNNASGQQREAVWAAYSKGEPVVEWFGIQPLLREANIDVLLLFDCCNASQAARGLSSLPRRFELLAACGMGARAPPPSANSFTRVFLRELRTLLERKGHANITEVHTRITAKESGYAFTPVFVAMNDNRRSGIFLKVRVGARTNSKSAGSEAASTLALRISMTQIMSQKTVDEIVTWLADDLPGYVSGIEVGKLKTETLQLSRFVAQESAVSWRSAAVQKLDTTSKNDILSHWSAIEELLRKFSELKQKLQGSRAQEKRSLALDEEIRAALGMLELFETKMFSKVRQDILESADDMNEQEIEAATRDFALADLKLTSHLRMHQKIRFPAGAGNTLQIPSEVVDIDILSRRTNTDLVTAELANE